VFGLEKPDVPATDFLLNAHQISNPSQPDVTLLLPTRRQIFAERNFHRQTFLLIFPRSWPISFIDKIKNAFGETLISYRSIEMTKRRNLRPTQTPKKGKPKPTCKGKKSRDPESLYGTAYRLCPDAFYAALREPSLMPELIEELTEEPKPPASKAKVGQTPKGQNQRRKLAGRKRRAERNKRKRTRFLNQALWNAERHFKKVSK